jgi:bis(5'-nucleosyl)-tetraphosphatase (symmetrical)
MARWAIGDVQGCDAELAELLLRIRFSADRDQLWFVGDLVNRGPASLGVLRRVRALGANAITVLGNHDLHLLAVAWVPEHRLKKGDTLDAVLAAADREALLGWLLERPLAHHDLPRNDLLVHAGLVPQWHAADALRLASEVSAALRRDPRGLLSAMYGDQPGQWDDGLTGYDRLRFIINALTRLRVCTREGRVDLRQKGPPQATVAPWLPWFRVNPRGSAATRVVFGHWSALGFHRGDGVLALDTGCVWGGTLTAVDLDDAGRPPVQVPARAAASGPGPQGP